MVSTYICRKKYPAHQELVNNDLSTCFETNSSDLTAKTCKQFKLIIQYSAASLTPPPPSRLLWHHFLLRWVYSCGRRCPRAGAPGRRCPRDEGVGRPAGRTSSGPRRPSSGAPTWWRSGTGWRRTRAAGWAAAGRTPARSWPGNNAPHDHV